ncbi:hypothetical protein V8F20_002896 [Naviculisporaceae sp. PSN 640]
MVMDPTSSPAPEPGTSSSAERATEQPRDDNNAREDAPPAKAYYAPPTNEYGRLLTLSDHPENPDMTLLEESDRSQRDIIHLRIFGKAGHIQTERTTAFSWKQVSEEPVSLQFAPEQDIAMVDWTVPLSLHQVGRLLHGFCPEVMEDKWFVYAEGPDATGRAFVHFHRSWSGRKMAVLALRVMVPDTEDGDESAEAWSGRIEQLTWEKEGEGEKANEGCSEELAKFVVLEVCRLVLQVLLCPPRDLHDPPEWRGLAERQARYVRLTQTGYRGASTDAETIADLERLVALGNHPQMSIE